VGRGIVANVQAQFRPNSLPEQGAAVGPSPPAIDCTNAPITTPPAGGALQLDLRAGVGQYQDAGGLTACTADGQPVMLWRDQTAHGNNFTPQNTGALATFQTNMQAGLPMTSLAAANVCLQNGPVANLINSLGAPFTLYITLRQIAQASQTFWAFGPTNVNQQVSLLNNTNFWFFRYNGNPGGGSFQSGQTDLGFHRIIAIYDGSALSLMVDGQLSTSSGLVQWLPAMTAIGLGGDGVGTGYTPNFYVGDFGMYNTALSGVNLTNLDLWLACRWLGQTPAPPAGSTPQTPDAFWRFEETTGDRIDSVAGLHLVTNGPPMGTVPGKIGLSPDFSPFPPRFLSGGSTAPVSANGVSPFCFGFWVRMNSFPGARNTLVQKWPTGNTNTREYLVEFRGTAGASQQTLVFSTTSDGTTATLVEMSWATAIGTGQWNCIECWYDSVAHTLNLAVNGAAVSIPWAGGMFHGAEQLLVGAQLLPSGTTLLAGSIDCLSFWHTVPTNPQVQGWYNAGFGREWVSGAWSPP
jgi:hypothetical protein